MSDVPPIVGTPSGPPTPRQPLARLPFPPFVRVFAAVTLAAFAVGLIRLPRALGLGIAAERGQRDLQAGRYAQASDTLRPVIAAYPEAKDVRLDYAEACLKGGQLQGVVDTLDWFEGKEVSQEQNDRLNRIENDFGNQMDALRKAQGER